MGAGSGFLDYDGDGWLDLLLVGGGAWPGHSEKKVPALRLYGNNRDGTFTEQTEAAGLGSISAYGFGITAADYDNDGDEDFYFTTLHENMLFRNDGGRFTEAGKEAGVAGEPAWSTAAIFFDAERDGYLDLYVGNFVDWSPEKDFPCLLDKKNKGYCTPEVYEGVPGRFYHNNGDGTFEDRTEEAGFLPAPGKTLGVAELDFNRDGWSDLVIANDTQRDLLYENNGDGTFSERGMLSGIAFDEHGFARAGMGVDAGMVDNSGEVSIFVGNFSREMIGVYRYLGNGIFLDRAALSQIGQPSLMTLTFGLFLFDVDLDGDLDLFAANGHTQVEIKRIQAGVTYRQKSQLFLNKGDGTFEEADQPPGNPLAQQMVARGAAYADFDRDGDLDLLIVENGGPAHLWQNDLNGGGAFLRVHLEGRQSNRDGIGTRVVVHAGGQRMERRIRTGSSYLSQSEKTTTFGLGNAARVDSLLIYWPSGQIDRFLDIDANRELRLVEGIEDLEYTAAPHRAIARVR